VSEALILRVACLFFFAVLSHWTFTDLRRGYMTPIVPMSFREPRYLREKRPKAFWAATIWNTVCAMIFLSSALFMDFEL